MITAKMTHRPSATPDRRSCSCAIEFDRPTSGMCNTNCHSKPRETCPHFAHTFAKPPQIDVIEE